MDIVQLSQTRVPVLPFLFNGGIERDKSTTVEAAHTLESSQPIVATVITSADRSVAIGADASRSIIITRGRNRAQGGAFPATLQPDTRKRGR